MKRSTNSWIQIIAMIGQTLNIFGNLIPVKYQPWVLLGLGTAQSVTGLLAQSSNTDGTPQEKPFVPKQ